MMAKFKHEYEIGKIYNILRLKKIFRKDGRLYAETECTVCGRSKILRATDLFNSKTNSHSCQSMKHGEHKSRIYAIYANMKYRCYNTNCKAYHNYGGKGIFICDEWLGENGFANFYEWSIKNGYSDNLTIDRINANKNYEPSNCRWVTLEENVASANRYTHRRKANKGVYYGVSPSGEYFEFENANQFAKEHSYLNAANIRDVANKRKKTHRNWKFGFISEKEENEINDSIIKPQSTIENVI